MAILQNAQLLRGTAGCLPFAAVLLSHCTRSVPANFFVREGCQESNEPTMRSKRSLFHSGVGSTSSSSSNFGWPLGKLLIANRGEIACRIIRTARRLGIPTVAIYSEVDKGSEHVRQADEAVLVGPAEALKSYLNVDAIMKAIRQTGAQAVHPGYGFLSENTEFVDILEKEGVTFVGPTSSAIRSLGDKIESKAIAQQCGVSTIPGWVGRIESSEHAAKVADKIGYPVMVKASAGGGGKGMRIVWNEKQLYEDMPIARAEAMSSFKNEDLLIEKYVQDARHIEFQILGDKLGNVVYLPERDCSVQRRNQKVIEESPSPFVSPALRKEMGEQAVALAKAVGYSSTGTVEFVVDKNQQFYFLEMNTRLQVEHPVTEAVTGLDLVEVMLRVACGQPLPVGQEQASQIKGWAMEARVYAEDPARSFLPSPGLLKTYVEPRGHGIRVDTGVKAGSVISMFYDPMISKLIAHGTDRLQAIHALQKALDQYVVRGVTHNLPFLRSILNVHDFQRGEYDTTFIPKHYQGPDALKPYAFHLSPRQLDDLLASAAFLWASKQLRLMPDFLSSPSQPVRLVLTTHDTHTGEDTAHRVIIRRASPNMAGWEGVEAGALEIELPKRVVQVVRRREAAPPAAPYCSQLHHLLLDDQHVDVQVVSEKVRQMVLQHLGAQRTVRIDTPEAAELERHMVKNSAADHSRELLSPMTGTLVSLKVKHGDQLEEGDEVCVIEAMKMRNVVRTERKGFVHKVDVVEGQVVTTDQVLLHIW